MTTDSDNKENEKKMNFKYVKIIIENPYNSRDIILKIAKRQKGGYAWETGDGKNMYVGHSINLYNRIIFYFMPSILKTKARRVLRHLNKHGFNHIRLTLYILDIKSTLEQLVSLEQHFINTLNPRLNVDLVASGSAYHEPMSQEMWETLRKQKGTPVYIYEAENLTLLHVFDSKQYMYNKISIHHKSLQDCLELDTLYLDYIFLSLDFI